MYLEDFEEETDFSEKWEKVSGDEYLKFDRISNKKSNRPDLHAFLLLDELFPGNTDIVVSAEHDEIWLNVEKEQIESLTDEQIVELCRCGVRYDRDNNSLCMFA